VLQDVLNDLSGTPRPLEVKLFGDDYATLRSKAEEMAARIHDVPGLVDLYPGYEPAAPELRLRVDGARAARLGLTATDVTGDLDAALHGVVAATIRRPDRPIGVRVRYPDEIRFDPAHIRELPAAVSPAGQAAGALTTIGAVADFERTGSPSVLVRENLRPVVILTADHEGRDLGSVARDVERGLAGVALPEGYTRELGGQYQAQQETFRDLSRLLAFGLFAVLAVLLAQFRRARLALVVLASVPLAVVGALVTLVATGVPLNSSSLMGCVLLVGLVVKNGILLLEQAESLAAGGLPLDEALLRAGTIRVRPILMTTLATVAGLAPLALGIGAGAEIQRPLAISVIGGLLSATVVSLLVTPSLVGLAFRLTPRAT
jgi:multidrug efflux pump subunit AcrB